ncbi:MAG: 8-oxo-dGTP diphosphatase [Cyanobacteria bacterium P01_E01_bin.45]
MQALDDVNWVGWVPREVATLVFVIRQGEILLIRKLRGLGAGKINGPGGRLEPGESLLDCAVREVQEELRVTPIGLEYGGEIRFQFVDGYSLHVHCYRATDIVGQPQATDEAIPLWSALEDIPYDDMWDDDRIWLPQLIAKQLFSGQFLFEGDRLLDYALEVRQFDEATAAE